MVIVSVLLVALVQPHTDNRQRNRDGKRRHADEHIAARAIGEQRRAVGALYRARYAAGKMRQRSGQRECQRRAQGAEPPQSSFP